MKIMKGLTSNKIYAYALIAIVGYLLLQYFMPVLKLAGIVSNTKKVEGLTDYQGYEGEKDDPLFLARKNSSNISHLKDQIAEFVDLKQKVADLTMKVEENGKNIAQIAEANTKKTEQMADATKSLDFDKLE